MLLLFLFISQFVWGQEIPIGTNVISAKDIDFRRAVNILLDNRFRLKEKDETFGTATLQNIDRPALNVELRVKDSVCLFKESLGGYAVYYASKGDAPAFRRVFELLNTIVMSMTSKITYLKL